MQEDKLEYRSYPSRYRLINRITDVDLKGFRKLATVLPKWLLPDPKKVGEHILRTIHGFDLIINPSLDNGVELSLFLTGTYEPGILDFIDKNYSGKGAFVDVGANIGLMSIFAAQKHKQSEVVAFEAHPETAELLRKNVSLNGCDNIKIHQLALGNSKGEVEIYDNLGINRGGASIVVQESGSKSHKVEMTRFDDLNISNIEMVKVDVEGVELSVLKGMEKTIRENTPVLIVEVSDQRENEHGSPAEIMKYIQSLGNYSIYKLKGGKERRSALVEVSSLKDLPSHDNILCIPSD